MSWGARDSGIAELVEYFDRPDIVAGGWERLSGKPDELRVVIEEIRKCRESFEYCARNYFWLTDKERRDVPFKLWSSQELLYERVKELKAQGKPQKIIITKARQLGFCLDPSTRVLKADLTWAAIESLIPGDQVVAVDEEHRGWRGAGRQMRTATVLARNEVFELAYRLVMEDGRELIATGQHRFLVKKRGGNPAIWKPVKRQKFNARDTGDLIPGDEIRYVTKPWSGVQSFEDGWFGGLLDGEGSMDLHKVGGEINVSQVFGPVFDRARKYLNDRGYNFRVEVDERKGGDSSKFGNKPVAKLVVGRMNEAFRLIGETRPSRFIDKRWWEGRDLPGKKTGETWSKIVSVEPLGPRRMIDIQTSEGTFIAEGFVSHNSVLIEGLITWRTIFFSNVNSLIVSHAPHHSVYLFGIMCHFLERLPFFLKPMIRSHKIEEGLIFENSDTEDTKYHPGLNSRVVVQAANQLTGVGQGYRISAAHCCVSTYTQIRVASSAVCQIQDIRPLDSIYTSTGEIARVKAVFRSPRPAEMSASLKLWLNQDRLICTKDHPILTPDGFRPAGELRVDDWVRYPVRKITHLRDSFKVVNRGDGGARDVTWEERYPLDRSWGFFFGLFLANGNIGFKYGGGQKHGASSISFHNHTKKMPRTYDMLDACLGGRHRYSYQRNENTSMARVHYAALARYTEETFGHKEAKRIPDWVWDAGEEFCKGLVAGYIFGDGSFKPKGHQLVCRSIRPAITLQLRDLIASLGYGWAGISVEEAGIVGGRNCQKQWIFKANGEVCRQLACLVGVPLIAKKGQRSRSYWRYSEDKRFVEIQIQEVGEQWCDEFWDLEIDHECHDFATVHCTVHNSELADVEDWRAKDIIEADLAYALADNDETMAFIETTAKGQGRYYHKLWQKCEELGDKSKWIPMFFPAFMEASRFVAPEKGWRPPEQELRIREKVSREWLRCDNSACLRYRSVRYGGRNVAGETCLHCNSGKMQPFEMSDGQLAYFYYGRLNAEKDLESLKNFKQELALTPEDAFQLSGVQVFPYECFEFVELTIREPIARGFFDSHGIFHGIDSGSGRCPVADCETDHRWDDMPVEIWEYPRQDATYTIGADVSEGIGGDYSVAFVNKVSEFHEADEQVAMYRSNMVDPVSFAFPIVAMGKWYNEAMVSIEVNKYDTTFTWVRNQLQYPNLYRWKHVDSTNPNSNKWGWETNMKSRPRLYQTAIKFLKAKMWIIRSREFLKEMSTFQKDDYEDRVAEHDLGAHDDVLISAMISLYSSHDLDYDANLGFIPIRRQSNDVNTFLWKMRCMRCNHFWGSNDPNKNAYCPQCFGLYVQGEKNAIINMGHQNEFEAMTAEPEDRPQGEMDYELI